MLRTASCDRSRRATNEPYVGRSEGIGVASAHLPFTYRRKSSCGRTDRSMPLVSRPGTTGGAVCAAGRTTAAATRMLSAPLRESLMGADLTATMQLSGPPHTNGGPHGRLDMLWRRRSDGSTGEIRDRGGR